MGQDNDSWRTPMDIVKGMVEKWDSSGVLPSSHLDDSASELLSSKLRRIIASTALERGAHPRPERTGPFRTKTTAEETPAMQEYMQACARRIAEKEGTHYSGPVIVYKPDPRLVERFHEETPHALATMGLEPQEIAILPDIQPWPAVAAVRDFMAGPKAFLVLGGETGTGKSIAAASALLTCQEMLRTLSGEEFPRWTRRGLYVKASELSRAPQYGKEADLARQRVRMRQLLIIDDVGAESINELWRDAFGDLIDARMRGGQKTILTTNLPGKELRTRYGDRVIRRLSDTGLFFRAEKPGAAPAAPSP